MTFRWEKFGFVRAEPVDANSGTFLSRVDGGIRFVLMYRGDHVLASVGDERHMVSEDEALGWFSIWLPELAEHASDEVRQRFSRWTPQRWAERWR